MTEKLCEELEEREGWELHPIPAFTAGEIEIALNSRKSKILMTTAVERKKLFWNRSFDFKINMSFVINL